MKKHSYSIVNIGSVLLFMTFIVLCLVTFATLSLSGAVSEYQYSQKLAKHNRDYYQACGQAAEQLRDIDQILGAAYVASPRGYYKKAESGLKEVDGLIADFSKDAPAITYEIPVNKSQSLQVVLTLNPPGHMKDGYYKITAWKEIPSSQWNGDDKLNLIK